MSAERTPSDPMETGCRGKNPSNRRKSRLCGAELSNRKSQTRCCSY